MLSDKAKENGITKRINEKPVEDIFYQTKLALLSPGTKNCFSRFIEI